MTETKNTQDIEKELSDMKEYVFKLETELAVANARNEGIVETLKLMRKHQ